MQTFRAKIYKTGINAAVDVPPEVTEDMVAEKGYIRIKGRINGFDFTQTLMPVKDAPYRLFVNIPMLKGSNTVIGDTAEFAIAQDFTKKEEYYPMVAALEKRLKAEKLTDAFEALTPSRKKDILKYLGYIRTEATLQKNIDKVIAQLRDKKSDVRVP
ncbi:MAG: DUF1905 domain-containing protein [Flavobacterium sp.]